MWNDTDVPLAYFISFRCYGTWLHGDKRGSIDRHNNVYGTPKIPRNDHWREITTDRMKHKPVGLDAVRRQIVESAIRETCEFRLWSLMAVNVRTNHAHAVLSALESSRKVLAALKANSTRKMRESGVWPYDHSPWSEHGSRRNLWNETSIANAIDYVINGQGDDLPTFD